MMDAMAAPGPAGSASLIELGYTRFGLDGGWNYCFKVRARPGPSHRATLCRTPQENRTFHWASDGRPVWNTALFPDPAGMVRRARSVGLLPGWYLNNCGCAENAFSPQMADKVRGGVPRAAWPWRGMHPLHPHGFR